MLKRSLQVTAMVRLFLALWLAITPTFVWAGSMTLLGVGGPAAGAAFVGPADAITSPLACWSLRACTSALRGQKVANVCNSTGGVDVGCADMLSNASTGDLVSATINGIPCPGTNCTVKTLYFQTGSLTFTGAGDLTQATVANRPTLSTSCGTFNKSFCMVGGSTVVMTTATAINVSQAQPVTWSAVALRTSGAQSSIASDATHAAGLYFDTAASTAGVYGSGAVVNVAATDGTWHSIQGILTPLGGASSFTNADGTSGSTGAAGGQGLTSGDSIAIFADVFNQHLVGNISELLIYPIGFSGANITTMCHNQYSYWINSTSPC